MDYKKNIVNVLIKKEGIGEVTARKITKLLLSFSNDDIKEIFNNIENYNKEMINCDICNMIYNSNQECPNCVKDFRVINIVFDKSVPNNEPQVQNFYIYKLVNPMKNHQLEKSVISKLNKLYSPGIKLTHSNPLTNLQKLTFDIIKYCIKGEQQDGKVY